MIDQTKELERIRIQMAKRGMNQRMLAAAAGITDVQVSRVFSGKQRMTIDIINRLHAALGIDDTESESAGPEWAPEIAVMQSLVGLPADARARVLAWANDRWK